MKNLLGSKFGAELVRSRECLGASPLHFCAAAGHLDCCLTLINSSGQPRVDASNAFGQTPLMLAASRGGKGTAVLDMLLTAGANPSVRDADGERASEKERERGRARAPFLWIHIPSVPSAHPHKPCTGRCISLQL